MIKHVFNVYIMNMLTAPCDEPEARIASALWLPYCFEVYKSYQDADIHSSLLQINLP